MKMLRLCIGVLAAGFAIATLGADRFDIGKTEYDQSCATCHGLDGKGRGSIAQTFQLSVPDITSLTKRNGGVFPVSRVYDVIDGREEVKAHGTREMPIWGKYYSLSAAPRYDDYAYNPEAAVRGRILALIDYLHRLQQK